MFHDALKPLLVIVIVLVLFLLTSEALMGIFSSLRLITSEGFVRVTGVGVYWNVNCTNQVDYLDWGTIEAGSYRNVTVFIRNERDEPVSLFLNTTHWNPENAVECVTLTWNYDGRQLQPQETTEITFTLAVASSNQASERFKFDIVIGTNS